MAKSNAMTPTNVANALPAARGVPVAVKVSTTKKDASMLNKREYLPFFVERGLR
ncbi:MAG: hypothetical protein WC427_00075 [Candidatus Paceibacterota bacterium]|jgi:hypothetical protein